MVANKAGVWKRIAIATLITFLGWQFSAFPRGMLVAAVLWMRDEPVLLVGGMPSAEMPWYSAVLRERHGLRVRLTGQAHGDIVRDWFQAGHVSATRRLVAGRYGDDAFDIAMKIANERYRAALDQQEIDD